MQCGTPAQIRRVRSFLNTNLDCLTTFAIKKHRNRRKVLTLENLSKLIFLTVKIYYCRVQFFVFQLLG